MSEVSSKDGIEKYGLLFPLGTSDADIELYMLVKDGREFSKWDGKANKRTGKLSKFDHFKNAVDILWTKNPRSTYDVIWSPWLEDMIKLMLDNQYASMAGSASSGKSFAMALYGIVMYLAHPTKTKVVMSSTTIKMAHLRIWRSVTELWLKEFPGKMVYSRCVIKGPDETGELSDGTGIGLIPPAGGVGSEIDANFLGIKQDNLIVLLDEFSELPLSVLNACYSNLANNKHFEMKAASNPNSYHDPFGVFSKPVKGWASIDENVRVWETSRGKCMRFDAEQSPNILAGNNKYPWLPSKEMIEAAKRDFGEKSRNFYRMYKAMWFSGSSDETVFSEGEVMKGRADIPVDESEIDPNSDVIYCLGADPSFTQGGDLFATCFGRVIKIGGKSVLEVLEAGAINDDIYARDASRSYAAIREVRKMCEEKGVAPRNFAFDMTGAGIPFRDIVVSEWSSLPMGVNFGGNASNMQISPVDKRKGDEVYHNRVSELWGRMKGMIREGRIRGLPSDVVQELCERRWHERSGAKLRLEGKKDLKQRIGRSTDLVDALAVLVELVVRNGYMSEMEDVKVDLRASKVWRRNQEIHEIDVASDLDLEW